MWMIVRKRRRWRVERQRDCTASNTSGICFSRVLLFSLWASEALVRSTVCFKVSGARRCRRRLWEREWLWECRLKCSSLPIRPKRAEKTKISSRVIPVSAFIWSASPALRQRLHLCFIQTIVSGSSSSGSSSTASTLVPVTHSLTHCCSASVQYRFHLPVLSVSLELNSCVTVCCWVRIIKGRQFVASSCTRNLAFCLCMNALCDYSVHRHIHIHTHIPPLNNRPLSTTQVFLFHSDFECEPKIVSISESAEYIHTLTQSDKQMWPFSFKFHFVLLPHLWPFKFVFQL